MIEKIKQARENRENAYNPYSEYSVGAVAWLNDGTTYNGCNVEIVTFDLCIHAERAALVQAVVDGRINDVEGIAISTDSQNGEAPCLTCRQFMLEFFGDTDLKIISDNGKNDYEVYTLSDLTPEAFKGEDV